MVSINDQADQDGVVAQHVGQLYLTPDGRRTDSSCQVSFPIKRSHFNNVGESTAFPTVFRHLRCDAGFVKLWIFFHHL